ncbi:MAG: DUF4290 domain-containing protein [Saprospiraceae bacterium]|nr:DUF4290 domain-containing protein [Saprospiraceae bacterium]
MNESRVQLEYNSEREDLIIPEYGRHVQKLINFAKTIEEPDKQAVFIERIIDLMMQIYPQSRSVEDYREKLWKHIYRIANYNLVAIPPSGVQPKPSDAVKKPEPIGYPLFEAQFRHYGHNVQKLIHKALSMEAGPKRDGFVEVIGSYMKLAYKTWNKDHYVSDDVIKQDLAVLSDNQLIFDEDTSFDNLSAARRRKQQQYQQRDDRDRGDRNRDRDRGDRDRDRDRDRGRGDRDRDRDRDRDGRQRNNNNNRNNNRRKK